MTNKKTFLQTATLIEDILGMKKVCGQHFLQQSVFNNENNLLVIPKGTIFSTSKEEKKVEVSKKKELFLIIMMIKSLVH